MNIKTLCLILPGVMLAACTTKMPYRPDSSTPTACVFERTGDCPRAHKLSVAGSNAEIYVIELDDQGRPTLESQLIMLLRDIETLNVSTNVLLFVHGWRHTAASDDDNFNDFTKLMRELSIEVPQAKKTIGIYIAWRGQSVPIPGIDFLTFWDRKFTAHEIGHGATDVFIEMDQAIRSKRAEFEVASGCAEKMGSTSVERSSQCRFLSLNLVGHSFGGAILSSAIPSLLLQEGMTGRLLHQPANRNMAVDSVVLLNPAVEALVLLPMWQLMLAKSPCQPYLYSFTSETDWATKYTFSLGRLFNVVLETHRTIPVTPNFTRKPPELLGATMQLSEASADRNTIGHFEPMQTHKLAPLDANATPSSCSQIPGNGYSLQQQQEGADEAGFWNVYVDSSIIDGHGDIWNDNFRRVLIQVLGHGTRMAQGLPAK